MIHAAWRAGASGMGSFRMVSSSVAADLPSSSASSSSVPSSSPSSSVRVRYAPSPTGTLHLGGLRTALFNYLFARRHGGAFLLRIEDTDRARTIPGAVAGIEAALSWAGLEPDESPSRGGAAGPYTQSERLPLYATAAAHLVQSGAAYQCFCSADRLASSRAAAVAAGKTPAAYDGFCSHIAPAAAATRAAAGEPHVVRLRVPPGETRVRDAILGTIVFAHAQIDDTVLLKSDGWPTYHLASVVDDAAMRISHVIRGQEWIASTPKHVLLYAALNLKQPVWVHLPLLLNADRSKLSKRAGAASVDDFRLTGFSPEALLSYVATLGWTPPVPQRGSVHTLATLAASFDLTALHKSGAIVDRARLENVANDHIKAVIVETLLTVAPAALGPAKAGKVRGGGGVGAAADATSAAATATPLLALREGALPLRIPDTPAMAMLRSRVLPFLPARLVARARVNVEYLNALLVAQHERVGAFGGFVPLVVPFFLRGDAPEFIEHLRTPSALEARDRVIKAGARGGGAAGEGLFLSTSAIAAATRDVRARWTALTQKDFATGAAAVDQVKAAATAAALPPSKLMLPLRWALTGLDAGASLTDTLHLLGREEAISRLAAALSMEK